MRTPMAKRKLLAEKLGRSYEYRLFRNNPNSVKLPLPVSVFCYRISSTTFGFLSSFDRAEATLQLRKFATQHGKELTVTYYRDTQGPFASQIILWQKTSELVQEMSLEEYRAAMDRPKEIGWNISHGGKLRRGGPVRDVKTGKVVSNA
jgi:hypothetical protein